VCSECDSSCQLPAHPGHNACLSREVASVLRGPVAGADYILRRLHNAFSKDFTARLW
jgi:hypothetical protein